jgi:hypothetical protein
MSFPSSSNELAYGEHCDPPTEPDPLVLFLQTWTFAGELFRRSFNDITQEDPGCHNQLTKIICKWTMHIMIAESDYIYSLNINLEV